MENAQPPVLPASPATLARRRLAIFLKVGGILLLIALLHIPLGMTGGILAERRDYQSQAFDDVAGIWGRQQTVTGPILAVPYEYRTPVVRTRVIEGRMMETTETQMVTATATAYFLPELLQVEGNVEPEVRHRGIFDVVVYSTRLRLGGKFRADFAAAGIVAERIDWAKSRILLGISDLRGVRTVGEVEVNGLRSFAFESAAEAGWMAATLDAGEAEKAIQFTLQANLQGSGTLYFVPVGKQTAATLDSRWPDPSFTGAYLPVSRTVRESGFDAKWEVSHLSRGFAGSWTDRTTGWKDVTQKMEAAAFGVRFDQVSDSYGMAERARKYGMLFFVLVFAVFFLFETTGATPIHPLQYGIVGAALCLFFLGFLALSEFWATGVAYAVAATACTGLITWYAGSFLRSGRRALVVGSGLGATYGYLYFVLKSQDYALVAGTAALFVALALVMYFTRRVEWIVEPALGKEARA